MGFHDAQNAEQTGIFDVQRINDPVNLSELIEIFPDWDKIDVRVLAHRGRLPKYLNEHGMWIWKDDEPLFHPLARQIALKMALCKIYPDPFLNTDHLDEVVVFSVRELVSDFEIMLNGNVRQDCPSELPTRKSRY